MHGHLQGKEIIHPDGLGRGIAATRFLRFSCTRPRFTFRHRRKVQHGTDVLKLSSLSLFYSGGRR